MRSWRLPSGCVRIQSLTDRLKEFGSKTCATDFAPRNSTWHGLESPVMVSPGGDSALDASLLHVKIIGVAGGIFRQYLPTEYTREGCDLTKQTASLTCEHFFELSSLFLADQFRGRTVLSLLGKDLESWLQGVLTAHGCPASSGPMIKGKVHPQAVIEGQVFISEGATVEPTAYIKGPCFIGPGAEIRHGAYIRGNVYIGKDAVVGHTTEVKGSIFLDDAKAGHFAYVGDSILGRNVNLGAGTKLANLKLRGDEVSIKDPVTDEDVKSGLRKFGAIIGDHAQTGCNAVLSPGTILMPKTAVMPCVHFQGTLKKGIAR